MCVIIVKHSGVNIPDENIIRACFKANPHGAGYMFAHNGRVVIRKGFMNVDALLTDLREHGPDKRQNAVYHFRWATHGELSSRNCHPFPVTTRYDEMRKVRNSVPLALAHNGVLRNIEIGSPTASDTMAFAKLLANEPALLNDPAMLDKILGYANKVVTLHGVNGIRLHGGKFTEHKNGLLFSNLYWETVAVVHVAPSKSAFDYSDYEYTDEEQAAQDALDEDELDEIEATDPTYVRPLIEATADNDTPAIPRPAWGRHPLKSDHRRKSVKTKPVIRTATPIRNRMRQLLLDSRVTKCAVQLPSHIARTLAVPTKQV